MRFAAHLRPVAALLIASTLAAAVGAAPAHACGCDARDAVEHWLFVTADTVFSGTVERVGPGTGPHCVDRNAVGLRVETVWKGAAGERIDIRSATTHGECGFEWEVGDHYIVYALRCPNTTLYTHLCSGTRLFDPAHAPRLDEWAVMVHLAYLPLTVRDR